MLQFLLFLYQISFTTILMKFPYRSAFVVLGRYILKGLTEINSFSHFFKVPQHVEYYTRDSFAVAGFAFNNIAI